MQPAQQPDHKFKIDMFGSKSAGKSSILRQITDGFFNDDPIMNFGVDFKLKTIFIDDKNIRLLIWEMSSSERYVVFKDHRLKRTNAILMVYDITDQYSFAFAKEWIAQARQNAPPLTPIFLIGNKIDLSEIRVIDPEQGLQLAKEYDAEFYETSAKTAAGLREMIWELTNKLIQKENREKTEGSKLSQEKKWTQNVFRGTFKSSLFLKTAKSSGYGFCCCWIDLHHTSCEIIDS